MADQKLNEIPQVQSSELANVKAFFALMTNGEIKQMSKKDMASVVGGLLSIEGHSFQSVLTIIPQGGRHELPFHSGLVLITNQRGSTSIADAILRTDGTGKVLTDEGSQVVFFSETGGGATVSVYKENETSHWEIINNRSSEAQIRYSYVTNV